MNTTQKQANQFHDINFYKVMDTAASFREGKKMIANFMKQCRLKKKRHGITGYTYDVMHAVLRSVAPTMEDIKKSQSNVFDGCMEHNEFFCFTTNKTLAGKLNNQQDDPDAQPTRKTIYNQIQKLIKIGIITEKVNYACVGKRNPYFHERDEKGRGKIQLWINPQVMCINEFYAPQAQSDDSFDPSIFCNLEKTLPKYEPKGSLPILEELKSIDNTANCVDKVAFADAKSSTSAIDGKEQGNKSKVERVKNFPPQKMKGKAFYLDEMWKLLCSNLYPGETFNEQMATFSKECLSHLLEMARSHVQNYRAEQIRAFKETPVYQIAKNKTLKLTNFGKKLPDLDRAGIEILSHAIWKQANHCKNKNYKVYGPVDYLSSPSAFRALQYSIEDWSRIQANYFQKNKASAAYFKQILWINNTYSSTLLHIEEYGHQKAYQDSIVLYKKWNQQIHQDENLNADKIEKLNDSFIQKFKSLFNESSNSSGKT